MALRELEEESYEDFYGDYAGLDGHPSCDEEHFNGDGHVEVSDLDYMYDLDRSELCFPEGLDEAVCSTTSGFGRHLHMADEAVSQTSGGEEPAEGVHSVGSQDADGFNQVSSLQYKAIEDSEILHVLN